MINKKEVAAAAALSQQNRELMDACKGGSLGNVKKAIAEGADVNSAVRVESFACASSLIIRACFISIRIASSFTAEFYCFIHMLYTTELR